jgi:uncharacterized protein
MLTIEEKMSKLNSILAGCGSAAVAFSGGVDSTFLAAAAARVLGDQAIAVTACSETLPASERQEAVEFAAQIGIKHALVDISELESAEFVANDAKRCYYCKRERLGSIAAWGRERGYAWVLEGSNVDDTSDYRPGLQAVEELSQVRSPLLEAGLTKADIREISKAWGLPTWNKLSAACLSSRIVYGLPVTAERLNQVEAAEAFIRKFSSNQIRVRHHGDLARIEVAPQDIPLLAQPATAEAITAELKGLGFKFVVLDLQGYRTGSMNETLAYS